MHRMEQQASARRAHTSDVLLQLLQELVQLRLRMMGEAEARLAGFRNAFPGSKPSQSATNLAHYLALRRTDLRPLQERLAQLGLSSLGRGEAHIAATLDAVIDMLGHATGIAPTMPPAASAPTFGEGRELLARHTELLFGTPPPGRKVHVMVTLSSQAADDYAFVRALMESGMDCARINGAHDDRPTWERMMVHLRRAERDLGKRCRVLFDLAGHKIRIGDLGRGPAVRHVRVERDAWGKPLQPVRVRLANDADTQPSAAGVQAEFGVDDDLLRQARIGDRLNFVDTRGKQRSFILVAQSGDRWIGECANGAYVAARTPVTLCRPDDHGGNAEIAVGAFGDFPGAPLDLKLSVDDTVVLTRDGASDVFATPPQIGCTDPAVVERLRVGDHVWINDGKLGAVVESIGDAGAVLCVRRARPGGVVVRAEHGLNVPDTRLELPPLTAKDMHDLEFACSAADMVGLSFVETPAHIEALMTALSERGARSLPIVVKIETAAGVRNLPDILLGTLDRHPIGVMIARGDLAVELGNARLTEIQEELLWLCEAGHVPVIWATQVLEKLAKKGGRSRPEFTDAASGVRAECVMLNKGPYVVDAVRALVSVLGRMQDHQHKKTSRLRALHW